MADSTQRPQKRPQKHPPLKPEWAIGSASTIPIASAPPERIQPTVELPDYTLDVHVSYDTVDPQMDPPTGTTAGRDLHKLVLSLSMLAGTIKALRTQVPPRLTARIQSLARELLNMEQMDESDSDSYSDEYETGDESDDQ